MKNFLTFILLTISTASIGQNTQVETIRQNPQYKSQTFSSTTKGYFIKVELQFSDTTLIGFTLTGNCKKKCNFSFSRQAKQIGKTQNVSIPNGNNFISTEYAYDSEEYTFVFEISGSNNSRIRLKGIKVNNDKECEECLHGIIMGQLNEHLKANNQGE
ncbi:MAG: hypothetical protein ACKVQV_11505 [Bacteroidia bacterium]